MRNLELKVRCPSEAALTALIDRAERAGAAPVRAMRQRDTYFVVAHGRLKLREWWRDEDPFLARPAPPDPESEPQDDGETGQMGAILVAYARPNQAGSRLSDYLLSAIGEPATLRAALEQTLGVRVVVEKQRVLYRWGQTRIHFDRVAGLGPFVELETLLDRWEGPNAGKDAAREHDHVIALLGLDALTPVPGSYSDLLTARPVR